MTENKVFRIIRDTNRDGWLCPEQHLLAMTKLSLGELDALIIKLVEQGRVQFVRRVRGGGYEVVS